MHGFIVNAAGSVALLKIKAYSKLQVKKKLYSSLLNGCEATLTATSFSTQRSTFL